MTRRDLIQKWLTYGLGLLPVWLLDAYILPRYQVLGVSPILLPLTVAVVAVLEGAYAGTGFGLIVGLLWELAYPGGFGALVITMAVAGMICGALSQYALSQSFPTYFICAGGLLLFLDGLRIIRGLLTHTATLSTMLQVAIPEILITLLWSPLVWLLFRRIYRKVGGTRLA
jgi:rod shape-determining protein MreD